VIETSKDADMAELLTKIKKAYEDYLRKLQLLPTETPEKRAELQKLKIVEEELQQEIRKSSDLSGKVNFLE